LVKLWVQEFRCSSVWWV